MTVAKALFHWLATANPAWTSLIGALIASAALWLIDANSVLAGDRVKDGKDAYWQVDTTIKTDNPGYISVNIRALFDSEKWTQRATEK